MKVVHLFGAIGVSSQARKETPKMTNFFTGKKFGFDVLDKKDALIKMLYTIYWRQNKESLL